MKKITQFYKFCFSIKGRLGRKDFVLGYLGILSLALVTAGFFLVLIQILEGMKEQQGMYFYSPIVLGVMLIGVIICIPYFSGLITIQIKRLHDLNLSGWWTLCLIILGMLQMIQEGEFQSLEHLKDNIILSAVNVLLYLVVLYFMAFKKGTIGKNKYGLDSLNT